MWNKICKQENFVQIVLPYSTIFVSCISGPPFLGHPVYINLNTTSKCLGCNPPPLLAFFPSLQNAIESEPGHIGNLVDILCGHFDENKKWG